MLDFLFVTHRNNKGNVEVYPKFIIKNSNDLMIRGGDFYAIWNESTNLWSTDENVAIRLIDKEIDAYYESNKAKFEGNNVRVMHMWDSDSGSIDKWHKYCQKQMWDWYHQLDDKLVFANDKVKKEDYASKMLPYPLEKSETPAYDQLITTLYSPEERKKIEWAIGSVIAGDSSKIQKFLVFYGAAGTGKSTILNIIQQLTEGYYSVFDAKALGSSSNSFALEAFKSNPLVAIQHDGDLSRIEDNTRLNSLVSHELMTVNEKFKSTYSNRFKSFLFMGTNKPVKITDARSGLIRRLIDVSPTGEKVHPQTYKKLIKQIGFELGGIAYHCKEVYLKDPGAYDDYVPTTMLGASNDFYNFITDAYFVFKRDNQTTLKSAWEMYKTYCDEAKVAYPMSQRAFKEELKNYFDEFKDRVKSNDDETRLRNVYIGFKVDKFNNEFYEFQEPEPWQIKFRKRSSIFDDLAKDYPAQYTNENGTPIKKWSSVETKLSDIDTSKLHYVKVPSNHIVIDFDIPDETTGEKSFEKNLEEASKWPPTYAELSKSQAGIHLHYIYEGDVSKLARLYDEHIEIKVFTGNSSLRRQLTKCNDLPVTTINSGLPLKEEKPMIDFERVRSEKSLRNLIQRNLNKEIHPGTKPSIDFIDKILNDAYDSGLDYDVSDMRSAIFTFAAGSTHQADYCTKLVTRMKFKSDISVESEPKKPNENGKLVFYDIEVFPNLFLVNYKVEGPEHKVIRLINPTKEEIESLAQYNLVGFNCRRYDNHILYGRILGLSVEELYKLSQKIIVDSTGFYKEAYNLSYTDVYDFAATKQSLKKWEIELGIHHLELGLPWDQPVPEEMWEKVAEYCDNDVIATEAVFNHLKGDFTARKILAELAGSTVNDTTNGLTTKIIFGKDRKPQRQFNYRNLAEKCEGKPYFPGYEYNCGKSIYRGEEVGEGGYVYAEPDMYSNIALLDIASMHPTSIEQEQLFGALYTKRFSDIKQARIAIKHKDFETARTMLDGKLAPYLEDESTAKELAQALKIAINSVYGLTAAKFDNPFRDPRNRDNIVAKRGALFMVDLKHAVQEQGYKVAHIKTDSIKVPDADQKIIDFVMDFGKKYGYTFEHEATYSKMCLVNNAVYIAKYADGPHEFKLPTGEKILTPWTATGKQFQIPYVFKSLFCHAKVVFADKCETKSVNTSLYLDFGTEEKPERRFIGKVGEFCPMVEGFGGKLYREKDGKYYAATATTGFLWQESEIVKNLKHENKIDMSYYEQLADDAKKEISGYGDFEWFVSED